MARPLRPQTGVEGVALLPVPRTRRGLAQARPDQGYLPPPLDNPRRQSIRVALPLARKRAWCAGRMLIPASSIAGQATKHVGEKGVVGHGPNQRHVVIGAGPAPGADQHRGIGIDQQGGADRLGHHGRVGREGEADARNLGTGIAWPLAEDLKGR